MSKKHILKDQTTAQRKLRGAAPAKKEVFASPAGRLQRSNVAHAAGRKDVPAAAVPEQLADQIASPWQEGGEEASDFTPVKHELYLLLKHWYREARDTDLFFYVCQCYGGSEARLQHYAYDSRTGGDSAVLPPKLT